MKTRELVFSSKLVNVPTLVEHTPVPMSQRHYEQLIAYEPSKTVKRLKALITKYREQSQTEFEKFAII